MRKTLCLMICMVMLFTLLPISAFATEGQELEGDVWDGSKSQPTTIVQKDGVYYYEITTSEQLAYIAQADGEWLSRNYILTTNIVLNDITFKWDENGDLTNDTSSLKQWPMIGNEDSSFDGIFNGNGHSISGLWIDYSYTKNPEDYWGFFAHVGETGIIKNLSLINSDIHTTGRFVGGIAGRCYGTVINCTNNANITAYGDHYWSAREVGGIVGLCDGNIKDCINNGRITGKYEVGGIAGSIHGSIENCKNTGSVVGVGVMSFGTYIGGIAGSCSSSLGSIIYCENNGAVTGSSYVGGISGSGDDSRYSFHTNAIEKCANKGTVIGLESNIGGIVGYGTKVTNCYNIADVEGTSNVGGIIGGGTVITVENCYSIGSIIGNDDNKENVGAIVGSDGAIWGTDTAVNCFYLKPETDSSLFGCGGARNINDDPPGFYAKNPSDLKKQVTYSEWDFWEIWRITSIRNDGFPCLAWECKNDPVPLSGIALCSDSISMVSGDTFYFNAAPLPAGALISPLAWSSSDSSVVQINSNGKAIAKSAGTAIITATCGDVFSTCLITVSAREPEEYMINSIVVRNSDGTLSEAIPREEFFATVSVTKLAEAGNSMIFLASYTAAGQFKGLMYVSVEDLPVGATIKVTLPVDNIKNDIATLKAFVIPSFSNLQPIGNAVAFPAESQ